MATTYKLGIKKDGNGKWKIEVNDPPGIHPRIDVKADDTIIWEVEGVKEPDNDKSVVVFQFPLGNKKYFKRRVIKSSKTFDELSEDEDGNFISLKYGEKLEFTVKSKGVVPGGQKEFPYAVLVKEDCFLADGGSSPAIFVIIKDE